MEVRRLFDQRPQDLNARLRARLREAYAVGKQEHLRKRARDL